MTQPMLEDLALEGELVSLRPIAVRDARTAFELVHERAAVTDRLVWDGPRSREELVRRYESWARAGVDAANYQLAIVDRPSGGFCGWIGLRFLDHPHVGDLGYWLGEPYWSAGRGTEAIRLISWLAFEHLDAHLLFARVFQGNLASMRVLQKNGYAEDPAGADVVEKDDGHRERRMFSVRRSDWRERAKGFAPRTQRLELRPS